MRVFVTGATGFIGSAIVQELLSAGHQVLGLARSDEKAAALAATGATVLRGSLEDHDSLRRGAGETDGVIHTAFIHDFSNIAASGVVDKVAIETMGKAMEGTNKPLVITSGLANIANGRIATEEDASDPNKPGSHRVPSEIATIELANRGVRSAVVRLPPSVHDKGDHGFVPVLIGIARQKGLSAYVGEGLNRWPAVHRLDAANLFRLVLEKGEAGKRYHGIGDEGIPTKDIATVIGKHLNVPVQSITREQIADHFGWLGNFFAADVPASAQWTRDTLGWSPKHPSLIADLEMGHYFNS